MKPKTDFTIWKGRTAYQLIPDRFCKVNIPIRHIDGRKIKEWNYRTPNWRPNKDGEYVNDNYYGGNLKGIESKLVYLKELGFDMIYMTPICKSFAYHHYDVGDQLTIDPWIGNWDDLEHLCNAAHKLDILIMADLVFNHTGIISKYYGNEKYKDWYKYNSDGSNQFWYGFKDMPECNLENVEYQEAMTKVVEKYLEKGVDGIRLDLAETFPKNFLLALQRVKKKYPNALFVGEMWEYAVSEDESQRETSKIIDGELDSVMNYPIADAILRWTRYGNYKHFQYNFDRVFEKYPENVQNLLLNNIGTHDTPTTMTMLAGAKMNSNPFTGRIWDIEAPWRDRKNGFNTYEFRKFEAENDKLSTDKYELGKKLTKLALAIMYNLPGIPCVFQGTEIAETGYKDPFCRKPYYWDKDEKDMKKFVTYLGKYRKENKDILANGKVKLINVDSNLLMFERYLDEKNKIIFIANRKGEGKKIKCNFAGDSINTDELWIEPYEYLILNGIDNN